MALINAETKLCDVILHEPSVIPVINRFGIILGVGDKSIRTVCEEKNLDCEFFVTILNTFINEDYFPENRLKSFCATQIVNYLTQTNAYYEQFQIPNIERHFNFCGGGLDEQFVVISFSSSQSIQLFVERYSGYDYPVYRTGIGFTGVTRLPNTESPLFKEPRIVGADDEIVAVHYG